ncbi:MAG: hypothetical protein D3910_04390, partial [Candidatus Electrothrix sp. ATG2]|nr:hypothetical protein [Candidatus Electrothrix sp. ATG2]
GDSLESPDQLSCFIVPFQRGGMGVYMKVPGDSLESPDQLSSFVVPPRRGGVGVLYKREQRLSRKKSPAFCCQKTLSKNVVKKTLSKNEDCIM